MQENGIYEKLFRNIFDRWGLLMHIILVKLRLRGAVVEWLERLGYGAESRRIA